MQRFMGLLIVAVLASPGICLAQARAAGMPLRDGALPPGTVTVRVVRGDFANNLTNELVTLDVNGNSQSARTSQDGRATFAHLAIGARVRASAAVAGEALESETFELPAESGIRILLIAGEGAPVAGGTFTASPAPSPALAAVAPLAVGVEQAANQRALQTSTITMIQAIWVALTLTMGVYVTKPWWTTRRVSRTGHVEASE
jgi:hypothetical protein